MRARRSLVGLASLVCASCGEAAPRVDVAIEAPSAAALIEREGAPEIRVVASAEPEPDEVIDVTLPASACARSRKPIVRETRTLTELEALPMILGRILRKPVDACLAAAHERDPGVEGLLVLSFRLKSGGGMEATRVTAGVGDAELHRCVERVFDGTATPEVITGGIRHFPIALCADGRSEWREVSGYR